MGALKPAGGDGGARRAGQQPAMSHINGQPAGQAASAMVPLVYMDGRMIDALPCASKTSMACFNAAGMPLPPPPSHFISCNPNHPYLTLLVGETTTTCSRGRLVAFVKNFWMSNQQFDRMSGGLFEH